MDRRHFEVQCCIPRGGPEASCGFAVGWILPKPVLIVDDGSGNDLRLELFQLDGKVLDTLNLALDDMPISNPEDITKNEDLAYIVFASGSTGKNFRRHQFASELTRVLGQPKGVEIEHRNLSHFVAIAYSSHYVSIAPGFRVLQFATFAFDAAVLEWSQCLALGGTLCFSDMPQAFIGDYLADVVDANDISVVHLTCHASHVTWHSLITDICWR